MEKTIFGTACIFGTLAVVLGAFGAHGLEKLVNSDAVDSFETGVRYQMYHAFLLFVVGLLPQLSLKAKTVIYRLILIGVLLFSFSIYLLALNDLTAIDFKKIAFLTPLGGVFLICGWIVLGYQMIRSKASS
ncbi:DUF423 domain-containing protein [Maribacter sp. 2210JD10-5]|uniref:DUF423 domain-containing protein n=1 Tax=Maribacter sp. 2210JD10-5 TaxID=3386272 RepID=UPI0039BCE0D4